jgi:hypothetical protein
MSVPPRVPNYARRGHPRAARSPPKARGSPKADATYAKLSKPRRFPQRRRSNFTGVGLIPGVEYTLAAS